MIHPSTKENILSFDNKNKRIIRKKNESNEKKLGIVRSKSKNKKIDSKSGQKKHLTKEKKSSVLKKRMGDYQINIKTPEEQWEERVDSEIKSSLETTPELQSIKSLEDFEKGGSYMMSPCNFANKTKRKINHESRKYSEQIESIVKEYSKKKSSNKKEAIKLSSELSKKELKRLTKIHKVEEAQLLLDILQIQNKNQLFN